MVSKSQLRIFFLRPFASLRDLSASLDPKLYPPHVDFCPSLRSISGDRTAFRSLPTPFPSETPTKHNYYRYSWRSGFAVASRSRDEIYPLQIDFQSYRLEGFLVLYGKPSTSSPSQDPWSIDSKAQLEFKRRKSHPNQ